MALAPATWRRAASSATGQRATGQGLFAAVARWASRVLWLWPALLTFAFGCYHLGRPELWRDELWSWSLAAEPVGTLVAKVSVFNPAQLAYELGLHYWITVFGDSARSMRLPSVLMMAAAAAVVTVFGVRLAGTRAGLLAGLIFALVPSVSRFAQEVRYYAPQVLTVMLASLLLVRALDAPADRRRAARRWVARRWVARRWVAYAACVAVVGYVDIVALAVLAAHAAWAILRWCEERDLRVLWFAPAAAAGVAACLPVVSGGLSAAGNQVGWIPRPGVGVDELTGFTWNLFFSEPVAAAVLVLGLLAWTSWRPSAVAASLAVLPVLAVWLLSQGPDSYFFPRYLLYTLAGWAILAGMGLSRIHWPQAAACVLAIAVLGASDQQLIRQKGAHDSASYPADAGPADAGNGYYLDYAGIAGEIGEDARPGDALVYPVNQWQMIGAGIRYYLPGDLRRGTPLPGQVTVTEPQSRVWVVAGGHQSNPYRFLNKGYTRALRHYTLAGTWHRRGLTVFLLADPDAAARAG
jgi:mannosyltransferase